ncbi:hypothetical protein ABTY96_03145 [Streptomyces sp. NPDC096057]|uniref:hypothetical protein n=1 Tax=Streptomyces sp. NPDC096057 TaxID=3155543 RepID=UPI003319EBFC
MTEHVLKCRTAVGDFAEAHIDSDGDVRLETNSADRSTYIYARPEEFAAFARAVLADAEVTLEGTDSDVKIGDEVVVTVYRTHDTEYVNRKGTVTHIDSDDIPYRVEFVGGGAQWVQGVRKVARPSASPFSAHVDEAKRLLADTTYNGYDVVTLARELADRS